MLSILNVLLNQDITRLTKFSVVDMDYYRSKVLVVRDQLMDYRTRFLVFLVLFTLSRMVSAFLNAIILYYFIWLGFQFYPALLSFLLLCISLMYLGYGIYGYLWNTSQESLNYMAKLVATIILLEVILGLLLMLNTQSQASGLAILDTMLASAGMSIIIPLLIFF